MSVRVGNTHSEISANKTGTGATKPILVSVDGTSTMLIEKTNTTHYTGFTIGKTDVVTPTSADGNVFSGTYTPTLNNMVNISTSVVEALFLYTRVGDIVTVSGKLEVATTNIGYGNLVLSLPVPSKFTDSMVLRGTVTATKNITGGAVWSVSTGTQATVGFWTTTNTETVDLFVTFMYVVVNDV
jgi:hypothetical protein